MYPIVSKNFSNSSEQSTHFSTVTRTSVDYVNKSERFRIQTRNFERQYAHLYAVRLAITRNDTVHAAKMKWGSKVPMNKLCDLEAGETCVVIGTLYKDMKLKPSILQEISEQQDLEIQPIGESYVSDSDELILEDELQRIVLVGLDVKSFITGVVIALYGKEPEDDPGKFHVSEYCFKQLSVQPERILLQYDIYVALISGLELGRNDENLMGVQLLIDLVTGQLGDTAQQNATANIVRVIVAGNSLSEFTQSKDQLNKARYLTKKTSANSVEAIKTLDDILLQLSASVNVDLMPGEYDPANFVVPQQPLHNCMFPLSTRYETFSCVSNPYDCTIGGVRFLGSSGQSITDISRYTEMDDNMTILRSTLKWGHLAPTAPDTLGCYPFYDTDPFIINECPHVYFAGNQPKYQSEIYEQSPNIKVRLVTVPRFSESGVCVLVNLRTLETQPITFHHQLSE